MRDSTWTLDELRTRIEQSDEISAAERAMLIAVDDRLERITRAGRLTPGERLETLRCLLAATEFSR